MKAEITKHGILSISSSSELEAYALRRWLEENELNTLPRCMGFICGENEPTNSTISNITGSHGEDNEIGFGG